MKTLIIIDFQKDFTNQKGSLYVENSENAEQEILNYIIYHHDEISDVVFTIDWHSLKHCSFKDNGGIWPNHCVQYSEGAGISNKLITICNYYNLPIKIFIKGDQDYIEEYGAFDSVGTFYKNDNAYIIVNNIGRNCHLVFDTNNIVICGVAGDYCVKSSIENLLKYDGVINLNIEVLKNGIASIDNGTTLNDFIKENNLKVI